MQSKSRRLSLGSNYIKQNPKTLSVHYTTSVLELGGRNFACSPYLWGRWLLAIKTWPPRPPRPSDYLRYLGCQKIMEGSAFWGLDRSQNLLSDLNLEGVGDLRSNLWGHPRPKITKIVILPSLRDRHFYILQGHKRPWPPSDLLGRLRPRPQIRPLRLSKAITTNSTPRPSEAATLN